MTVKVVKVRSRYLVLRWECPISGRTKQKSAKTNDRRKAERAAAKLEEELRAGTYFEPNRITWAEFREQFEELRVPNFRPATARCYDSTFNRFEQLANPNRLAQIDARMIIRFQNKLREIGNRDTSICKHLRHLKAALNWAKSMEFIARVPEFQFPKAGRHQTVMKGRPVTEDEFQKMLEVVPEVVGKESAQAWRNLLNGIWFSGLRLGEALALTWHPSDSLFVDFDSGKYPLFKIRGAFEKGGRDRIHPMTPDFGKFLDELGIKEAGLVFPIPRVGYGKKDDTQRTVQWVSVVGTRIGKEADIVVSNSTTSKKHASFHDLRRSFGDRWANKVMPQTLMKLMRHESIDTTLRFYVGDDAEKIGEEIWALQN